MVAGWSGLLGPPARAGGQGRPRRPGADDDTALHEFGLVSELGVADGGVQAVPVDGEAGGSAGADRVLADGDDGVGFAVDGQAVAYGGLLGVEGCGDRVQGGGDGLGPGRAG